MKNNNNNPIDNWFAFIDSETNGYSDQIIPLFDISILIEKLFHHAHCPFSDLEVTIQHYGIKFKTNIFGELSDNSKKIEDPFNPSPYTQVL
jgi:hypothetical protein